MSTASPPPAPARPVRRLVRRTDDRLVAGVAGGLADVFDLDPVLVRIGFVVLAFAGGAGVIAYVALWMFTPEGSPDGAVPVQTGERGAAFWVAIGLFVLAALLLADAVADRSVVWPLVLIGTGVALWRSDGAVAPTATPARAGMAASSTTAPTVGAMPFATPVAPPPGVASTAPVPTTPAWTPPPPPGGPGPRADDRPSAPRRSRERSLLGRMTIGLALVTIGVLTALDRADVLDVTIRDSVAAALLVLGLGLVVGSVVGRARWLSLPAVLVLVPALVVTTAVSELNVDIASGVGQRTVRPASVDHVEPGYELGIGELVLDLSGVVFDGGPVTTEVRVGLGQVTVVVPDDVTVDLTWRVTGGEVELLGDRRAGRGLDGSRVFPGTEDGGTLRLHVSTTFGQLEVLRASDASLPVRDRDRSVTFR